MIQDPKSDEPTLLQAMDRLEAARSEVSRTRTLMLYRIRRILTEEQNVKMKAMHDRDRAERERKNRGQDDHANHPDCH